MFPSRNLWYDSTLHATSLPNKDLPKLIHFSYRKGSFIRHNKAYKIRIHICQYLYFRTLWSNFDLCKILCCVFRVFTQSPMALWETPCMTQYSMPPSPCVPERSWTTAGGEGNRWEQSGKTWENLTPQILKKLRNALLFRQQYFHTDYDAKRKRLF